MADKIERTLVYTDDDGQRHKIHQDEITTFTQPVVILGDPGLGKTELTRVLGESPGMTYVRAGTFERCAHPASLIAEGECIIIDGADEIASAAPGGAVDKLLRKLSEMGYPPFILSCREADWKGAVDQVKIKDDYDKAPILLHLQPFSRDDAKAFLAGKFPSFDAECLLVHLVERRLDHLYGNPLTLQMLGEIMEKDGELPETKGELFERVCHVMLREENSRHHGDRHVNESTDDDRILAAGAVCAAQILCNFTDVYMGIDQETPDSSFSIKELSILLLGNLCVDAVRTRLFRMEGEGRFTHIHRAVAEYLGARWLAHCFEGGISKFSLFRQGEGVPTSLRGLHAWLAHFSDTLAERCINADPYGVLLYGDTKELNLDRARDLINTLKQLSENNPYFRIENWDRHSASGLVRTELKDDIHEIVENSSNRIHLRILMLEVIIGSPLAEEFKEMLKHIVLDCCRSYRERFLSWKALYLVDPTDQKYVINQLPTLEDVDSARLACNILDDIGINAFSIEFIVNTILARLCITINRRKEFNIGPIPSNLFDSFDLVRLSEFLDRFSERARCLMDGTDRFTQHYTADLVRHLVVKFLKSGKTVEPAHLWSWIDWFDGYVGNEKITERLAEVFHENRTLRFALIEHVLLTPCAQSTRNAGWRLDKMCLDLFPTTDDLVCVLKSLWERIGCDQIDTETWQGLLELSRTSDGIPPTVRDAAVEVANRDPRLLLILNNEISKIDLYNRKIENKKRKIRDKERKVRDKELQSHRDIFHKQRNNISNGDLKVLYRPASIYLGYERQIGEHIYLPHDITPKERLRYYLGDELNQKVLEGFVAVLGRQNLPIATNIVEAYIVEGTYRMCERFFGIPMICGIVEILRRGRAIDEIDRNVLAATYMALRLPPDEFVENDIRQELETVQLQLETVLFRCESDWEEHFRTLLEPQMDHSHHDVFGLHRLTDDSRFVNIAGRLSVEWLRRFPALPASVLKQLLTCAMDKAPEAMIRALVIESRTNDYPDDIMLMWRAADFTLNFNANCTLWDDTVAKNRRFLLFIRDLSLSEGRRGVRSYSLNQCTFIVKAFGRCWPKTECPTASLEDASEFLEDASEFIEKSISAIAGNSTPEATEVLETLIAYHAPSYVDIMRHALAQQRRDRRDSEYRAPTIKELQAVMTNGLPETIDQMRTWFEDRIDDLRKQIRGSNTNMWKAYWKETDQPQDENYCRDRMIEHISNCLPESIRLEPEASAPGAKRMDIALTRNQIKLPIEIKGQWHKDVWDAAIEQLAAKYAIDHQAEDHGIYIVLWFGDKINKDKKLKPHPDKLDPPETPEDLERMLKERLPEVKRSLIDVYVVDLCPMERIGQSELSEKQ